MNAFAVLGTAALLGLFVLMGGGYGGLYSFGRLWHSRLLLWLGRACCAVAVAVAVCIALFTPLHFGWKLLILFSAAMYVVIPPMTWRYMEKLHPHSAG